PCVSSGKKKCPTGGSLVRGANKRPTGGSLFFGLLGRAYLFGVPVAGLCHLVCLAPLREQLLGTIRADGMRYRTAITRSTAKDQTAPRTDAQHARAPPGVCDQVAAPTWPSAGAGQRCDEKTPDGRFVDEPDLQGEKRASAKPDRGLALAGCQEFGRAC